MPAITFYRHGLTASIPNMGNPNPPKRGTVKGWSATAARRNTNFLRSVDETTLDGFGYAATLTLRNCPPSSKAWTNLIQAWMKRQSRAHMKRLHWVMEFQRRGVPHLHAAIWYKTELPDETTGEAVIRCVNRKDDLISDWLDLSSPYESSSLSQHVRMIDGAVGWFRYMSKHCSRSQFHYQRQQKSLPEDWQTTGRVWGHRGQWETIDPATAEIDQPTFWRVRRLVKKARIAEARAGLPLNSKQVAKLRRILKCSHRPTSEVRPVSEWMSEERQHALFSAALTLPRPGASPP